MKPEIIYLDSGIKDKETKYNNGSPIEFDSIPQEEKEQALIEFSEGSKGLELALRALWSKGIKTFASCAGNASIGEEAYIATESGYDMYSYLSEGLLKSKRVVIQEPDEEGRQTIYFYGTLEEKESFLEEFARDIATGPKNLTSLIQSKYDQDVDEEWKLESIIRMMKKAGYRDQEISEVYDYLTKKETKEEPEKQLIFVYGPRGSAQIIE